MLPYGSSLTGFGLKDSDVNLDLVIPDEVVLLLLSWFTYGSWQRSFIQLLCKVLCATVFFNQKLRMHEVILQLFAEMYLEKSTKVHMTTPKGIVGSFLQGFLDLRISWKSEKT